MGGRKWEKWVEKRKGGVPVRCLSASGWMKNGRKLGTEGRGRVGGGSMGEEGKGRKSVGKKRREVSSFKKKK